jgi:chromosome segregation ATPase
MLANYLRNLSKGLASLKKALNSMDDTLNSMDDRLSSMDDRLSSMDDRLSSMQDTVRTMDDKLSSMQDTVRTMDDKLSSMEDTARTMWDTIHSMQMEKLNLYIGNMLFDFIENICQRRGQSLPPEDRNDPSYSTSQHVQVARHLEPKNLKDLNVPLKYYHALQKFSKVCNLRPSLRAKIT